VDDDDAELKKKWDEFDNTHGIDYFDREGKPMSTYQYMKKPRDYKRVALTKVGQYNISTVWLGLDHSFGHGPPLIFETMIFWELEVPEEINLDLPSIGGMPGFKFHRTQKTGWDDYCDRYHTEAEAIAGHAAAVEMVRLVLEALGDKVVIEDLTEQDQEARVKDK
jgi:hypothetical protein